MIVLSWNCRGLGNRRAVQVLADLVRKQGPKILFLMEKKLTKTELEPIQRELNFHSMIVVPSRGRSGGLALMWKDDVLLNTYIVSPNHIDAYVSYPVQVQWRLTGIYGHLEDHRKNETWYLMHHLHSYTSLPWLCIGDFNEILSSDEKNGRIPKPLGLMQAFRSTLLHCGLVDLGYSGKIFTWRNGRQEMEFVEERLDRACANNA